MIISIDIQITLVLLEVCCSLGNQGGLLVLYAKSISWCNSLLFSLLVSQILVFFKYSIEILCWLKKCDFIVLFINHWSQSFMLIIISCAKLILFNFELMGVFEWPFIGVLEVNSNLNRKFSIACVMDFKRMLLNCNKRFRKALVDLKLNFFY